MNVLIYFEFVLFALLLSAAKVNAQKSEGISLISNGILTVGVNTVHGGAISYLVHNKVPTGNLINNHDQGREVQQSYYAGPRPYRGANWPWNPISSGDHNGHGSHLINLTHTDDFIYVKARPLQWALDNVPCNCTFETYVTLDENGVFVRNRLVNFRADHTDYGAHQQELPAVYTIGNLYEMWSYVGSDPWSGAALTQVPYPVPGPPWHLFNATENWAAFTTSDHFGVGVHHRTITQGNLTQFLGGFHGSHGGGPSDDSTGYLAPYGVRDIVWNDEWVWCFRLSVGYLDNIRGYFSSRRGTPCSFPINRSGLE
jgi:hypothetical protein